MLRWRKKFRKETPSVATIARRILTRDEILNNLEESLKRLRRDRIDIYLIHEPEQFLLNKELEEIFEDIRRQKLIGAWGLGYDCPVPEGPNFGQVLQCCASKTTTKLSV